jgi:hypothetical protein
VPLPNAGSLVAWWRGLADADRRDVSILVLVAWGYLVHYACFCLLQPFFIEDSAISFAYARNAIDGHGLVAVVGGERVEGFSNPLWTLLIALFYAAGVAPWSSAKFLGGVLGLATLSIVYALVRRAAPSDGPWFRRARWMAPLLLAGSPQFVVWNASGLESSLFSFLLVLGLLLVLRESESERPRPWSAVVFFLLALTRPEGMMYGVVGFVGRACADLPRRRLGALALWLVVLTVPWIAFNAARWWYFAWPLPNTYYAKLGTGDRFAPLEFDRKGWAYVAAWFERYGFGALLPVIAVGLCGTGGGRGRAVLALSAVLLPVLAWKGDLNATWTTIRSQLGPLSDDVPARFALAAPFAWAKIHWGAVRAIVVVVSAAALGVLTLTRAAWHARGLLWLTCCATLFYVVYVGGDWMVPYRWFNTVVPTLFPIVCLGLAEVLSLPVLQRTVRTVPVPVALASIVLATILGVGVWRSNQAAVSPETAVRDVHRRVMHMSWVQERLDLDRVNLLDVDMGAHMYFTDWDIVDIAGLIDVPIAHHPGYDARFMREYLYEEERPEFAHVHGSWARLTKILTHPEWKKDYLEIPGYRIGGRTIHPGAFVRKDLFVGPYDAVPPRAAFGPLELATLDVDAATIAPGGRLGLSTAWHSNKRGRDFRVFTVLASGDAQVISALPLGYDWYPPKEWKNKEAVATRHWIDVPADFPLGPAMLGVVALDASTGLPLLSADDWSAIPGTWWSDEPVAIVSDGDADRARTIGLGEALLLAERGACGEAWPRFKRASRHVARDTAWFDTFTPIVREAEARCWLARATATEEEAVAAMERAVRADREVSATVARPFARTLDERGDAASASEDWEEAYEHYLAAIRIDPTRAWTRKKLERVRDARLGLVDGKAADEPDAKEGDGDDPRAGE